MDVSRWVPAADSAQAQRCLRPSHMPGSVKAPTPRSSMAPSPARPNHANGPAHAPFTRRLEVVGRFLAYPEPHFISFPTVAAAAVGEEAAANVLAAAQKRISVRGGTLLEVMGQPDWECEEMRRLMPAAAGAAAAGNAPVLVRWLQAGPAPQALLSLQTMAEALQA